MEYRIKELNKRLEIGAIVTTLHNPADIEAAAKIKNFRVQMQIEYGKFYFYVQNENDRLIYNGMDLGGKTVKNEKFKTYDAMIIALRNLLGI